MQLLILKARCKKNEEKKVINLITDAFCKLQILFPWTFWPKVVKIFLQNTTSELRLISDKVSNFGAKNNWKNENGLLGTKFWGRKQCSGAQQHAKAEGQRYCQRRRWGGRQFSEAYLCQPYSRINNKGQQRWHSCHYRRGLLVLDWKNEIPKTIETVP